MGGLHARVHRHDPGPIPTRRPGRHRHRRRPRHRRRLRDRAGRGGGRRRCSRRGTEAQLKEVAGADRGGRPPGRRRPRRPQRPRRRRRPGRHGGGRRSAGSTSSSTTSAARCPARSSTPRRDRLDARVLLERRHRPRPHPRPPCRHMLEAGGGAVVGISSMMGRTSGRGFVAYGTAKAGLSHWTRLAAQDLAPRIRVNAIAVGSIATSALEIVLEDDGLRTAMEQSTPLKRIGDPEEIAATVLFLASRGRRLRHRQGRRGRRRHRAAQPRHGPPRSLTRPRPPSGRIRCTEPAPLGWWHGSAPVPAPDGGLRADHAAAGAVLRGSGVAPAAPARPVAAARRSRCSWSGTCGPPPPAPGPSTRDYTVGVTLPGGMAIEELVFFTVIPVCGLLTLETVRIILRRGSAALMPIYPTLAVAAAVGRGRSWSWRPALGPVPRAGLLDLDGHLLRLHDPGGRVADEALRRHRRSTARRTPAGSSRSGTSPWRSTSTRSRC